MERVPFIALLWSFGLIYLPRFGPVAAGMKKQPGGYNNNDPRAQQATLEGRERRAVNAHNNGFEAFAPFAAALIVAMLRYPKVNVVAGVAIAFAVVRTVYVFAYLGGNASLRSAMWTLGMLAIGALMVLAIIGP